ncbi:synaptonemal complex central element protein 2 [Centropristis striata]|uniref:synaptonemal complex central element protein 2 n=1 Tax=Centropristis striata TaxID=184440 RepID=UPI0027DFC021|nr:synaptonemal complex central element protein 2 [Centropristis striata]
MDFFFDDLPSTSTSTPNNRHDDSLMTGDTDQDSSREKSSSTNMPESAEQQLRMEGTVLYATEPSSADDISGKVQELVEKINNHRASDQKVMDTFQEKLIERVTEMCQQMKEHMYTVYEDNSEKMQVKLQELQEVLRSCTKLQDELIEASRALASLRGGLAISRASEP